MSFRTPLFLVIGHIGRCSDGWRWLNEGASARDALLGSVQALLFLLPP
jgi:hypothetical protein